MAHSTRSMRSRPEYLTSQGRGSRASHRHGVVRNWCTTTQPRTVALDYEAPRSALWAR